MNQELILRKDDALPMWISQLWPINQEEIDKAFRADTVLFLKNKSNRPAVLGTLGSQDDLFKLLNDCGYHLPSHPPSRNDRDPTYQLLLPWFHKRLEDGQRWLGIFDVNGVLVPKGVTDPYRYFKKYPENERTVCRVINILSSHEWDIGIWTENEPEVADKFASWLQKKTHIKPAVVLSAKNKPFMNYQKGEWFLNTPEEIEEKIWNFIGYNPEWYTLVRQKALVIYDFLLKGYTKDYDYFGRWVKIPTLVAIDSNLNPNTKIQLINRSVVFDDLRILPITTLAFNTNGFHVPTISSFENIPHALGIPNAKS